MTSSILQQYWTEQERQRTLFSPTHSIIPTIDEQYDRITNKSESFLLEDFQSNSNNLSTSSSTNLTIKEFCPVEKEDGEEEKTSWKRRICAAKCKTCTIGFILGGLLAAIALSTVLTIYIKDHSATTITTTTSTTSTSSTSTSSSSTTSTTSTTSASTSTSTTSTSTSTSSTSSTSSTTSTTSSTSTSTSTTSTSTSTSSTSSTSSTTSTTSSTSTTSVTDTSTTTSETTTTAGICANGETAVTFDDLNAAIAIPSGYTNINWTNADSYTTSTNSSGYYTGTVSEYYTSYNPYGSPMTMQCANNSLINLYFAAVAAAWCNNLQLTVVGYNSNVVIVNNTYTLQIYTVAYITFIGYSGLDTIIFSTSGGTSTSNGVCTGKQYAMDNICLSFT